MKDKRGVLNQLSEDLMNTRNFNKIKEIITIMCSINNEPESKRYFSTTLYRHMVLKHKEYDKFRRISGLVESMYSDDVKLEDLLMKFYSNDSELYDKYSHYLSKEIRDSITNDSENIPTKTINELKSNINDNNNSVQNVYSQHSRHNSRTKKGINKEYYKKLLERNEPSAFPIVLNFKEPLDELLLFLAANIAVKQIYIATGFLYKSGLKLLDGIISDKAVDVELIVGSLQNYNKYSMMEEQKVIFGMDKPTAIYLNNLLSGNAIELKTLEETFYHGKFYLLVGKKKSCIIIGSSNVSNSAFNMNRELDLLYIVDNKHEFLESMKVWYKELSSDCVPISELADVYFNDLEIEYITNYAIGKMNKEEITTKINELTDDEVKYRLNLWMKKNPENVYTDLQISSLPDYILFEFKEYNLLVFESFNPDNAYYTFEGNSIEKVISMIKTLTKTEIFNLSNLKKRGYHIDDKIKLENIINSLFIKTYRLGE